MSPHLAAYLELLDALCSFRRVDTWTPEDERPLLEQVDFEFELLEDLEADAARGLIWRAFPDQVDKRMDAGLREDLDPDDRMSQTRPPRRLAA